jgi:hypothetical protein
MLLTTFHIPQLLSLQLSLQILIHLFSNTAKIMYVFWDGTEDSGRILPTFRMNILPPYSGQKKTSA